MSILASTKPVSLVPDVIREVEVLIMLVCIITRKSLPLISGCRCLSLPALCGFPCSIRNGFLGSDVQPHVALLDCEDKHGRGSFDA